MYFIDAVMFKGKDTAWVKHTRRSSMARKVVRVYLSIEQKKLLERLCKTLGIDESEALREAFMDYAKSISLITEIVHGKI